MTPEDRGPEGKKSLGLKASCKWNGFLTLRDYVGVGGGTLTGKGQCKSPPCCFPLRAKTGRVDQPEPVTLPDEDVTGHLALRGWQSPCLGGGLAD